tara:strand:- start:117 stop:725 length:609 start_codon:yes stop_codon:yes gene_type:complete
MAEIDTIRLALRQYASNYGRGNDYCHNVWELWQRTFEHTPDQVLNLALDDILMNDTSNFIPPLGALVEATKRHGAKHRESRKQSQKCIHCNEYGHRQIAIHHWKEGKYTVTIWTCRCDCPMGESRQGMSSIVELELMAENMEGYIEHWTTHSEHLQLWGRDVMSQEEHDAQQARLEDPVYQKLIRKSKWYKALAQEFHVEQS